MSERCVLVKNVPLDVEFDFFRDEFSNIESVDILGVKAGSVQIIELLSSSMISHIESKVLEDINRDRAEHYIDMALAVQG